MAKHDFKYLHVTGYACAPGSTTTTPVMCVAGQFSTAGSVSSCDPCAGGRYGDTDGATTDQCTGECTEGMYLHDKYACVCDRHSNTTDADVQLCVACFDGLGNVLLWIHIILA